MSTYPTGLVSSAELPTRVDGAVIYGAHMNLVQDEIIALEAALGVGTTLKDGYSTVVDRLANFKSTLTDYTAHKALSAGVHGAVGTVVGTTDTQTLSNKTLVAPTLSGHVAAGGAVIDGAVEFTGNVTFDLAVSLGAPSISSFANATHDHSTSAKGGNIPISSVTGLSSALSGTAGAGHTHVKADITNFQHTLDEHTGSLDVARITGVGTAALLNVPVGAGTVAMGTQVVRGDDPRLTDGRTAAAHAATHAVAGSDPVSAASIGAAAASHTHTKSNITDFAHLLSDHTGSLPISSITSLQTSLDGKLAIAGTAVNSTKVNGKKVTVSPSSAPASPAVGDVWIDY